MNPAKIAQTILVILLLSPMVLAQRASPAFQLFEQAVTFVTTQYFGFSTLDIPTLADKYRLQLLQICTSTGDACSYEQAEPVINQMMAEFQDNHAYYLSAAQVQARNASATGVSNSPTLILGFSHLAFFTDTNVLQSYDRLITNVLPGSPADKGGLRYGDRWIGYGDVLFSSITTEAAYTKALTDFTAAVRSGADLTMRVIRGVQRENLSLAMRGAIFNTVQQPSLRLENNVAIMRIRTFATIGVGQNVHDLLRSLETQNVIGLVLDLRGNGGGFANERWITVGAFIANPERQRRIPRYEVEKNGFEESYENGAFIVRGLSGNILQRQNLARAARFEGKVIILIDGGCASACEYLSSSFRRAQRAIIIGEQSVGIGNTNTQGFNLVNGGAVSLPTFRSVWLDGTGLPTQIIPDIITKNHELELFNTGIDQPLTQAISKMTRSSLK
jgi:carboxyl-terminal processing protease